MLWRHRLQLIINNHLIDTSVFQFIACSLLIGSKILKQIETNEATVILLKKLGA